MIYDIDKLCRIGDKVIGRSAAARGIKRAVQAMKNVVSMIAAASLTIMPQVSHAEPVQVTYSDAVRCAALDSVLAIAYLADENPSEEDATTGTYLSNMATKWTEQAGAAHPQGAEAAEDEIAEAGANILIALGDSSQSAAAEKSVAADIEFCGNLEEAAYGGFNGIVD